MAETSRWRRLLVNLAVMTIALLVVLVVLESAARLMLKPQKGKEQRERAAYTEFDPTLGWRLRPGASARYERDEYSTEVAINSLGMRDRERTLVAPAGTFRILALGDSFIEGYTVSLGETVSQSIERALNHPTCPAEVINAGSGGYSTDQEYLLYRETARRFGARVVLLFFFHNDLAPLLTDNYYGAPKPCFTDDGQGGLTLTNNPIPEPPPRPEPEQEPRPRGRRRLRSVAWAWLQLRLSTGAPRVHDRLAHWGLWEPMDRLPVHPEMRVFRRRPSRQTLAAWTIADRLLAALKREVEADGARLVVVYVPSKMEVDDRAWQGAIIRYSLKPERWSRAAVVRRLAQSGRQAGFPVLDLTPPLRAASAGLWQPTYLRFDGHWNARGHRVAADAIVAYLRGAGLLPSCATVR